MHRRELTVEHIATIECIPFRYDMLAKVPHPGPVVRIKTHPKRRDLIATRSTSSAIYLYSVPQFVECDTPIPEPINISPIELTGHSKSGIDMSWNETFSSLLMTSASDGRVNVYDINQSGSNSMFASTNASSFQPMMEIPSQTSAHPLQPISSNEMPSTKLISTLISSHQNSPSQETPSSTSVSSPDASATFQATSSETFTDTSNISNISPFYTQSAQEEADPIPLDAIEDSEKQRIADYGQEEDKLADRMQSSRDTQNLADDSQIPQSSSKAMQNEKFSGKEEQTEQTENVKLDKRPPTLDWSLICSAWTYFTPTVYVASCPDSKLAIYDLRGSTPEIVVSTPHTGAITSLSTSHFLPNMLLTASEDSTISMWDFRNLTKPVHNFTFHQQSITQVEFSPTLPSVFLSADLERLINIWDISKIGDEVTTPYEQEAPPELLFTHGGHTSHIYDVSWNMMKDWMIASVSADASLQIWEMAQNVHSHREVYHRLE
ncbi:putative WD-40 repeat-containing protein [Monocercomonoides exilis]|uniref:putative WD-40 repeat-containing protein n=1 Tax=Monocercomonoides exilis TaxID=2049356 RepID=UPI003559FD5D|nr:putative WD-40 repeat-containing protein [Monocercomonoides exilis]|eukprot:MONOS_173.1-p1 / transcript=MONOS_173.1 / gene=MONOS_173 / organism=Monocercomonoides_exilis_PA203 / gene_product=WD-40 repeat-containing protein / transcript_product=WD-40 repeat-containing protein / location=Mono_scaffold00003:109901-112024(+) / protein_length=491 / sequence_SO=supercontig / SO=protein_coding / is_pseudo=false